MVAWLAKDGGQASRVLHAMGPAAEPALLEFVAGAAQPQLRADACRVLKDIGTSRSLPVLRELASKRQNEELGRVAGDVARNIQARYPRDAELTAVLEGLVSIDVHRRRDAATRVLTAVAVEARRAEVSKALLNRLSDPDNETQRVVIRALGAWGDPAVAPALVGKLKDPAFLAWREAIEALGKIGRDRVSADAIALWVKQDRGIVLRTLEAIGPPAEPAAIALVQSQEDWGTRAEACKLLGAIGSKACIPPLQEATKNRKDAFVVMAAEAALKRLDGARLTDAAGQVALEDLKSADANRRREAARGLADAQPDPARRAAVANALATALSDRDENVQREALRALRAWGDRTSAAALADRCKDRSFGPWREALEVLTRLDPRPQTAEVLIERMPDDYGHGSRLLHELGAAAEPALLQAFQKSPDLRVRVESCRVLEAVGTLASLPVLQAAEARTGDGTVAAAAEDALRGIAERE